MLDPRFDMPAHILAELEAANSEPEISAVLGRHLAYAHGALAAIMDVANTIDPDRYRDRGSILRLLKIIELATEAHAVKPATRPPELQSSSDPN